GLPGSHRELQRLLANPRLVPVPACWSGRAVRPLAAACGSIAAAPGGAARCCPPATAFPAPLGVESEAAAARPADLHASHGWDRGCGSAGATLCRRCALAEPAGAS